MHSRSLEAVYYVISARTHLGDDDFLVGSIEADDPLAHIEDHGAHHPLPCLQRGENKNVYVNINT